jgi:hypothetical protein
MSKQYYRIFDEKDSLPHTLFHGVNGSRRLELNTWHDAKVHEVQDSGGKPYICGFHVLKTEKEAIDVLSSTFTHTSYRVIVPVLIDEDAGIWEKKNAKADVMLAKRMKITNKQWLKRKRIG